MPPRPDRPYFGVLDGLRGIAALAVAVFHLPEVFDDPQRVPHGAVAVDFFFMLSGFVLAAAYEERLRDGRLSHGRLIAVRLIRLMPMAALGLMLGAAAYIAGGVLAQQGVAAFSAQVILGLLLLPDPWPQPISDNIMPLNWPGWSLFFELYVGTALALVAPRLSNRGLAILVAALAALFAAAAIGLGSANLGWSPSTLQPGLARFGFTFLIGWLFWRIRIDRLVPATRPALAAALLLAVLALPTPASWDPYFELAATLIACPIILALGSACRASGRTATVSRWLGDLSYPIYAIHAPVFLLVGHYVGLQARAFVLPAMVILAAVALLLYDAPLRHALRRKTGRPTPSP